MFRKFIGLMALTVSLTAASNQAFATSPNTVRGFVYEWFGLFDDNAPAKDFLERLSPEDLEVVFPEETLRSHAEFGRWYEGILATFSSATHDVKQLRVEPRAGGWEVDLTVEWRASKFDGEVVQGVFHQVWQVEETADGRLLIRNNIIEPVAF